jgi:battenin
MDSSTQLELTKIQRCQSNNKVLDAQQPDEENGITSVSESWRNILAFWIMGLLNNSIYVIMNAGAKYISSGGVGLVYTANIAPVFLVKATLPYWYHLVSYRIRIILVAAVNIACLLLVGLSDDHALAVKLLGVAVGAFASGLGEATFLGLASQYNAKQCITAWASGTGFAGVFGYAWNQLWVQGVGLSFNNCALTGLVLPILWLLTYFFLLGPSSNTPSHEDSEISDDLNLTFGQKFTFIITHLWKYMLPLVIVYFSEYAMQAGAWASIGFPIYSTSARNQFYSYAGWCYQAGVFISRSSGTFIRVNTKQLWIMPMLQAFFLVFFCLNVVYIFWFNYGLLAICLITGLLGGAVYVHAFLLISREIEPSMVEFSLTAASLADTFGIFFSDIAGVFIQGCLYAGHNLVDCTQSASGNITCSGPVFSCGHTFDLSPNPKYL